MALREKKSKAIELRKLGWSYSQIKEELGVSKSSLSLWLKDMPLTKECINEIRAKSPRRIERFRETMRLKHDARLDSVRETVALQIGKLSERDILIAGLFLYWGEGSKTTASTTSVSNTDPAVLRFFIDWLLLLGVSPERIRIRVQLYKDMDADAELGFWSETLEIPLIQFRKAYIKDSLQTGLSYPQRFIHGTCNVIFESVDIHEQVLMSLEYLRSMFAEPARM